MSFGYWGLHTAAEHPTDEWGNRAYPQDKNGNPDYGDDCDLDEYMYGQCASYALGHKREYPHLRVGIDWEKVTKGHPYWHELMNDWEDLDGDDPDNADHVIWRPQHYFTHDDHWSYDAAGARPLSAPRRWQKTTLDHDEDDLWEYGDLESGYEPDSDYVRKNPPRPTPNHTASTNGIRYAHVVEADVADDLMRLAMPWPDWAPKVQGGCRGCDGTGDYGEYYIDHPDGSGKQPGDIMPGLNGRSVLHFYHDTGRDGQPELYVSGLHTDSNHRQDGVAESLMRHLHRSHPGTRINPGFMTDDGQAFHDRMLSKEPEAKGTLTPRFAARSPRILYRGLKGIRFPNHIMDMIVTGHPGAGNAVLDHLNSVNAQKEHQAEGLGVHWSHDPSVAHNFGGNYVNSEPHGVVIRGEWNWKGRRRIPAEDVVPSERETQLHPGTPFNVTGLELNLTGGHLGPDGWIDHDPNEWIDLPISGRRMHASRTAMGLRGDLPENLTFEYHHDEWEPSVTARVDDVRVGTLSWFGGHPDDYRRELLESADEGETLASMGISGFGEPVGSGPTDRDLISWPNTVSNIGVDDEWQRRGIGLAMFDHAKANHNPDLTHSFDLTHDGHEFSEAERARHLPKPPVPKRKRGQPAPTKLVNCPWCGYEKDPRDMRPVEGWDGEVNPHCEDCARELDVEHGIDYRMSRQRTDL